METAIDRDSGDPVRIVVIEDNPADADAIRLALDQSLPCTADVTVADGIDAARALLLEVHPDVVLLDLSLPGSRGLETYRSIKDAAGDAAVVIVTGSLDQRAGVEAVGGGADDYLVKGRALMSRLGEAVMLALIRKRAAVLDRREAESERLDAVKRLGHGIAHHFNNLSTVVMGYAMLLLRRHDIAVEVRQGLTAILDASRRGAALTRHLLGLTSEGRALRTVSDAGHVLGALESRLRESLEPRIALSVSIFEGGLVPMSALDLEQIVITLVLNAREAMPDGGRIHITVTRLAPPVVGGAAPGDAEAQVVVSVSDSGVGMEKDVLRRALEPFFSTKDVGQRAGLGLSVVQGSVRRAGGFVSIASDPDHGTTFRIHLPLAKAAPAPAGH